MFQEGPVRNVGEDLGTQEGHVYADWEHKVRGDCKEYKDLGTRMDTGGRWES